MPEMLQSHGLGKKMKLIKENWLVIILVVLFGGNLIQFLNPIIKIKNTVTRDTITTVDSTSVNQLNLINARIELLKDLFEDQENKMLSKINQIDSLQKFIVINKADTLRVDSSLVNAYYVAILDTVLNSDSLRVEYYHPYGYWNLRHVDFTTKTLINTTTIIEKKSLFDFNHGIILGAFVTSGGNIKFGIGYGFKLGVNL